MSMEMTMNFKHMVPWGAAYADFELAQQNAMKATKAEKILAMKSLRSAFEKIVGTLIEHAGLTNEDVLQAKRRMNKNDERVDLYGKVLALSAYNIIDMQSARNYEEIRILGNYGTHDCAEPYASAGIERIQRDLERMLELLHKETLLFVNKYMNQPAMFKRPALKTPAYEVKIVNSIPKVVWVIIIIAVVLCFIMWVKHYETTMEVYNQNMQNYYDLYYNNPIFQ